MTFSQECFTAVVGLAVLCLALLMSICLNVILWVRKGASPCGDTSDSCCHYVTEEEIISQNEGQYFHALRHRDQPETPPNHDEQQENPIYGNISTQRGVSPEACYEMMTMQRKRDCMKHLETDLNYASLDLKRAKKHKKQRCEQSLGRTKLQDQPAIRLTPPTNSSLEVDADVDACLPSRDTSMMVSHSSIYLNSQQIALETEEMEREWSVNVQLENNGWDGVRGHENEGRWDRDQECQDRNDEDGGDNENVCIEHSNGEALQSSTDCFIHIFSKDNEPGE